jgi:hypothetical protein
MRSSRSTARRHFECWTALGVRAQPTAVLFDSCCRGQFIWYGAFDESEVLEKAAVV